MNPVALGWPNPYPCWGGVGSNWGGRSQLVMFLCNGSFHSPFCWWMSFLGKTKALGIAWIHITNKIWEIMRVIVVLWVQLTYLFLSASLLCTKGDRVTTAANWWLARRLVGALLPSDADQRGKVLNCCAPFKQTFFFGLTLQSCFFSEMAWFHFVCNPWQIFRQEMCSGRCTARCFLPRAVELGGSEEGRTEFIELD